MLNLITEINISAHWYEVAFPKHGTPDQTKKFSHLDEWLEQKSLYANRLMTELSNYSFLKLPNVHEREPSWYAFVMNYIDTNAGNVPIEFFYRMLLAEGLAEVDRPQSTRRLNTLPLFHNPGVVNRAYTGKEPFNATDKFPNTDWFVNSTIKLPVWATERDSTIFEEYLDGILKVCKVTASMGDELLELSQLREREVSHAQT